MDESPYVTVVIPTNNRLPLLRRAIASVLAQTFGNWEVYIVDDGSTDGTQEAIRSMNDPRIHLVESENAGNVAALRNEGARAGTGEWLAFLDSDDLWMTRKLEWQLVALRREEKRWCYTRYELMDEEECPIPHRTNSFRPLSGWITDPLLLTKADITICSVLVKRSLFEEAGGFNVHPKLLHRTDYELILRLSILAEVIVVPDLLVRVREHAYRSTNNTGDGHEQSAHVFAHFLRTRPAPELARLARQRLAYHLAEVFVEKMKRRLYRQAAGQLWKALAKGDKWRHVGSALRRGIKLFIL